MILNDLDPRENESLFQPNEFELDKEWVAQPSLYLKFATALADARARYDQAKAQLDVIKANVNLEVRKEPQEFGISKVTESVVSSAVATDVRVVKAQEAVTKARHEVDILTAAVTALEHKKAALEKLVQLHLASYYAKPVVEGSDEEAKEVVKKAVRQRGRQR